MACDVNHNFPRTIVFVDEQLTPDNMQILRQPKELDIKYVCCREGKFLSKKYVDKSVKVRCMEDLIKLKLQDRKKL